MTLPFTVEQFFRVFAAYNALLWLAAFALWVATAVVDVAIVGAVLWFRLRVLS